MKVQCYFHQRWKQRDNVDKAKPPPTFSCCCRNLKSKKTMMWSIQTYVLPTLNRKVNCLLISFNAIVAAYIHYCSVRYSFMARIKLGKNPPTVMQINPPIVLTFTRQRWSSTNLQSITCLARVNIKYNSSHGFAVFIHLATINYFYY